MTNGPRAPSSPPRLPSPRDLVHAQRARLGLRDRRAGPAGLQPHAQRAGDHRAVAVQPARPRARRSGGDRSARPRRRPPRAAGAVSRRGRRLRGVGAADLRAVAGAHPPAGRDRRRPRARRARADARGRRGDAQARRRARGRQHAAQRLLLGLLRHRSRARRPHRRRLWRERRAVGQRRDLPRHDGHAGDEPVASARPRRRRRSAGSRACAPGWATRSATAPCAGSSSPTRRPWSSPR